MNAGEHELIHALQVQCATIQTTLDEGVIKRLDALNGAIADHEVRIQKVEVLRTLLYAGLAAAIPAASLAVAITAIVLRSE